MKKIILSIVIALAIFAIGLTSVASMYAQTAQSTQPAQSTETTQEGIDSATIYSQLTADQIFQLEMQKLRMKNSRSTSVEDILVPFFMFLFSAVIVFLVLFYSAKDKRRRYALMEKAIENGQPLPELYIKRKKEKNAFHYLTNGILFTFLGTGFLVIPFATMGHWPEFPFMFVGGFFASFGLAFLLIGLIKFRMEKKEKSEKQNIEE